MARINKVGHVVLWVSDLDVSTAFYRDALGMEVAYQSNERGAAFLSFGTQHHDIALFKDEHGGTPERGRLAHIAFQIEGGLGELKELRQRLVDCDVDIDRVAAHGMTYSVYFRDPDGNDLEIFSEVFEEPTEGLQYMRDNGGTEWPLELDEVTTV